MEKSKKYKSRIYFFYGVRIFILIYGSGPLDVTNDGWILNGYIETDIIQHYAGWLAYRGADSFFPPTFSDLISFPKGDYTSLADSIPLMEIIFKNLSPVLPETFQFFGLFCCFSLGMQAVCASKLCSLFNGNELSVFLSVTFFCLSPVMLERMFRHTSLSAHWLILLALYFYFKDKKDIKNGWKILLVCLVSTWIHIYFTPMIIGILLAWALDGIFSGKQPAAQRIGIWAAAVCLCLMSMKVLGILSLGLENTSGYGYMGMNLNALFNPLSLDTNWWVPGGGKLHWSAFLPIRALALNNIESFNYLGLGILAAAAISIAVLLFSLAGNRRQFRTDAANMVYSHLFFILFLLFSTLFAISNTVCAFSYQLFTVPLPDFLSSLFNPFRASGRMFWPVNYTILLFVLMFISSKINHRTAKNIVLALLLAVQIIDLSPALVRKHNDFNPMPDYPDAEYVDTVKKLTDRKKTAFFLEVKDDRILCTLLLKEGVSNNLLLISRDGYGVEENSRRIENAIRLLKSGENVYEDCVYVTSDPELAESICENGKFVSRQAGRYTFLYNTGKDN